uniref:DNA gyrase C-terminal beta-propeller domain-containing protein n=1 Tax=Thauera sp. TaxID=1905334 RepID=UPI00257B8751
PFSVAVSTDCDSSLATSMAITAWPSSSIMPRTPVAEYTRHGRGTKGMIAIQTSDRNGKLVGAVLVEPTDEVMLISTGGVLIRTSVESIREMGRSTQGVTLINLDDGTFLASIEKVAESESDESMRANGDVAEEAGGSEADVQVDASEGETPAADEEGEA